MNETHNNLGTFPTMLILGLIALSGFACIVLGGLAVTSTDGPLTQFIQADSQVDLAALPENEQERALDRLADVARSGNEAVVAVAISGDLAQTAIVKNQTSQLWAVAAIFGSVAVMYVVKSRKDKKA